jgi:hypothetical protein
MVYFGVEPGAKTIIRDSGTCESNWLRSSRRRASDRLGNSPAAAIWYRSPVKMYLPSALT